MTKRDIVYVPQHNSHTKKALDHSNLVCLNLVQCTSYRCADSTKLEICAMSGSQSTLIHADLATASVNRYKTALPRV